MAASPRLLTHDSERSPISMTDAAAAVEFLKRVFGPVTTRAVFVCSLPNDRNNASEPGEKRLVTRDMDALSRFVAKWDRPGRGMFFCVGTLVDDAHPASPGGSPRTKANVAEIHLLQADIDLKDIETTLDDVIARVTQLPLPPSIMIRSGNGLHAYWLLNEAIEPVEEDINRVEATLRQIGDLVGGDLKVAEIARLMRLPGTHNSKGGAWSQVTIVQADYDRRYELDNVEEMLGYVSPIVRRKATELPGSRDTQSNPFLAIAQKLGFKPPIDVERRLAVMSYQGGGETSIHETQLQVSASLLNQGAPADEVVDILLSATRAAAGEYGQRWNWTREERALRRMCEDWLRKHPVDLSPRAAERRAAQQDEIIQAEVVNGGAVVQFSEARAKRDKAKIRKAGSKETPTHVILGQAVVGALLERGEHILVTTGQVWRYADKLWSCPALEGRRWLEVTIETACRALGLDSSNRLVSETRQWILRHPDLYREDVAWDAHGKIPTRSGLVDYRTSTVEPPRPEHHATWRIETEFAPEASCPWWRRMVEDSFADRTPEARVQTIAIFQEIVGAALIESKPRSLTRALVLQGPPETGKSQILEVVSGLLTDHPISTPLEALEGTHGTMPFKRRAPWVLHEAFDQSKWHFSSKAKQILTGDPIEVNTKSGLIETIRVRTPVFWGTNHPPTFRESTRAIVNRMIILRCRAAFRKDAPIGTALEARRRGYAEPRELILKEEMPGLLNWALDGLKSAMDRGFFLATPEIEEALEEVRTDTNMVAGFLDECVEFGRSSMISVPDFCAAFSVWWVENKGETRGAPSNDSIGRAMASVGDARIGTDRIDLRDAQRRYYAGIRLTDIGLDYWNGASTEGLAQGKTARISSSREQVNRLIPAAWDERSAIRRLRQAFDEKAPDDDDTSRDTSDDTSPKTRVEKCHFGRSVTDTSYRF